MKRLRSLAFVLAGVLAWSLAPSCCPAADDGPAKEAQEKPAETKEKGKKAEKDKKKEEKKEEKDKKNEAAKPAPKKAKVVRFLIHGAYPEGSEPDGLFGQRETTLAKIVARMDEAARDKSVDAVLLEIEDAEAGMAKINELRAAVGRIRKAGKPVVAALPSGETREYLLATACDQVVMPPSGTLMLPGVRAEMTFYKGLLDKLGIQFEVLQMGDYKGAGEPMSRTSMSPALRDNMEGVVDDAYRYLLATLAADRKLDAANVSSLVDQGMFTAEAACQARLIDRVAYADEVVESLRRDLKADEIDVVRDYQKKRKGEDFSGLAGMMKLMELAMGGKQKEEPKGDKRIAVIYAVGVIVSGKGSGGMFGEDAVGSQTLTEALRTAANDSKVLAVVLRVDSPGGSALASDLIWREVTRLQAKKPVIVSMGNVAASGGYYISMGAGRILATPETITGSIGVIGGKPVVSGLLDKIGVTTEVISRGKNSGAFSITKPFTGPEREAWMKVMRETYSQFVAKAAEGRKLPRPRLEQLAQGRVYTGRMAVDNGLVDGIGTLEDAIAEARKAAGLKPEDKADLLILPKPKNFFEELFGDPSAMSPTESTLPEMVRAVRMLGTVRTLFREPSLVLMPCGVELK